MSTQTTDRRKLLVVANRAPVTYVRTRRTASRKRGGGGLVTALAGLIAHHDVTWIASAMSDEDRAIAAERGGSFVEETADGDSYRLRLVAHDPPAYELFYNVVANPTLWFLQHYLWVCGSAPDFGPELHEAWSDGYVPVNEAFAAATLEELDREPDAAVLFHDYHLYLAPRFVREARPRRRELALRPHPVAGAGLVARAAAGAASRRPRGVARERRGRLPHRALAAGLLALGGTAAGRTCRPGSRHGRARRPTTRVVAHPISVDAEEFDRLGDDPAVLEREAELVARRPEQLVLRVDRIDPSKNIVRGFDAFGLLLERHPELHGRVGMLALLAPVAAGHPGVRRLRRAVEAAAAT